VADQQFVMVRFFAAARAAAGVDQEQIEVHPPATVADVVRAASDRHGPQLAVVLRRCSFLLDEMAVHGHQEPVTQGSVLDVLPPFAGG
jgi:molybdopterin converting factor small subunit